MDSRKQKYRPREQGKKRDAVIGVRLSSVEMEAVKKAFKQSGDENFHDFLVNSLMKVNKIVIDPFKLEWSLQEIEKIIPKLSEVADIASKYGNTRFDYKGFPGIPKKEHLDVLLNKLAELRKQADDMGFDFWREG